MAQFDSLNIDGNHLHALSTANATTAPSALQTSTGADPQHTNRTPRRRDTYQNPTASGIAPGSDHMSMTFPIN